LTAATFLGDCYLDLCSDEKATEWLDRARTIAQDNPGLSDDLDLTISRLESAISRKDAKKARELYDKAISRRALEGGLNRARWADALEVRIRQMEGEIVPPGEIDKLLLNRSEITPISGVRDFEISTAVYGLVGAARIVDARNAADTYLKVQRQFLSPVSRALRDAIRDLDIGN
jgi:hypothetical protein